MTTKWIDKKKEEYVVSVINEMFVRAKGIYRGIYPLFPLLESKDWMDRSEIIRKVREIHKVKKIPEYTGTDAAIDAGLSALTETALIEERYDGAQKRYRLNAQFERQLDKYLKEYAQFIK